MGSFFEFEAHAVQSLVECGGAMLRSDQGSMNSW
jgi:hypothetical protein